MAGAPGTTFGRDSHLTSALPAPRTRAMPALPTWFRFRITGATCRVDPPPSGARETPETPGNVSREDCLKSTPTSRFFVRHWRLILSSQPAFILERIVVGSLAATTKARTGHP